MGQTLRRLPAFLMIAAMCALILQISPSAAQATTAAAQQGDTDAKIWDGVYTAAQAERGKAAFETTCARCHKPDLSGDPAPPLKGDPFMGNWEGETLDRLFVKVRDTMPPNSGARLDPSDKLDIVAYILQVNTFPTGSAELKQDSEELEGVRILRKGTQTGVPNFALVEMVGCLTPGPDHHWLLTNASEPVVTRDNSATAAELRDAQAKSLGTDTFLLVNVAPSFSPASHNGHKMQARGLLYRDSNDRRLNLASLQMIASSCVN